jgi:radical SAM-linked protein
MDMEFEEAVTPREVKERLNAVLPEGIRITEVEEAPPGSSSASLLRRSIYWIELAASVSKAEASERIAKALGQETLVIAQERKGKPRQVDIRPSIERMEVKPRPSRSETRRDGEENRTGAENDRWGIELVLLRGWSKTAKPLEIVSAVLGVGEASLLPCEIVKLE